MFRDLYGFCRRSTSNEEFVSKFEHVYFKIMAQNMSLLDYVLAFYLLKTCSLSNTEEKIVVSGINDTTYKQVKSAL